MVQFSHIYTLEPSFLVLLAFTFNREDKYITGFYRTMPHMKPMRDGSWLILDFNSNSDAESGVGIDHRLTTTSYVLAHNHTVKLRA